MAYQFGQKSLRELKGVHLDLVAVANRAIQITSQDFAIHDGLRSIEEQRENVRRGVSQTMASKHLPQADGFGHAFDAVPVVNGKLRWEWQPIYHVTAAVRAAAIQLGVSIRWGGVWDRVLNDLPASSIDIEEEVEAYVGRRRAAGKRAFIDGPHFELA
ncbi:MAG: M15 family metallopeptidase [Sphingomonas sp.]|nr:M15 family metallopeptidase [Sphingomonas sp.]